MEDMTPAASGDPKGDSLDNAPLDPTSTNTASLPTTRARPSLRGTTSDGADSNNNGASANSRKAIENTAQQSYSPWDMPPIIQPVASNPDTRILQGLKGFSNLNSTWPHFRSKPHPTISVPITPTALSRSGFDMAAPSTPPRSSVYSNAEDSDNAMCTPTFGSNYSRRNSAVSVMALDTPPPLSLMDLESTSSSLPSGSSFGSSLGLGHHGHMSRPAEHGFGGTNHSFPFPPFGMRHDASGGLSRRSSRANSFSMESRHVRKYSEDTCMSDGGNNSGSERSRRHSPAVVSFERSGRRSALLPKPKGLLKVFSQLEEEIHHNKHEYDHERETTQVRKAAGEDSNVSLMETGGATSTRQGPSPLHPPGNIRRPSTSKLNPDQELSDFPQQQEEYSKLYQLQQLQHLAQLQHQQQQQQQHQQQLQQQQQQQSHQHPLQVTSPMQETQELEVPANSSYAAHISTMGFMPPSPLQAPMATRAKRKSSTCEERFDPYHSNQLKRRAVSPSIGPMVSHWRSPSSSPARHLAGHSRSKIAALPSPSGTGPFSRHGPLPLGGGAIGLTSGLYDSILALDSTGPSSDDISLGSRESGANGGGSSGSNGAGDGAGGVSSSLNLQHTSRSFSELSLDKPKSHAH